MSATEEIVSAVAIGNLKAVSEQPAMYSNLAYSNSVASNNLGGQNAVSNQQAMNELGLSVIAKGTKTVSDLQPLTARSSVDVLTNNELAQTMADLKSVISAFTGATRKKMKLPDVLALLEKLADLNIHIDDNGDVVFKSAPVTILVEGEYTSEDVVLTFDNKHLKIEVSKGS